MRAANPLLRSGHTRALRAWIFAGFLGLLVPYAAHGQAATSSVPSWKTLGVTPRGSLYALPEPGEVPLVLHRTALDVHLGPTSRFYIGGSVLGAVGGIRAGYIALGGQVGTSLPLGTVGRLRVEGMALAGGGGSAPDGSGAVLGGSLHGERSFPWGTLELGLLYSHSLGGGTLGGWSPSVGFSRSFGLLQPAASPNRSKRPPGALPNANPLPTPAVTAWGALPFSMGLFAQQAWFRHPGGDPAGLRAYPVSLVGAVGLFPGKSFDRSLTLAAAVDTFGGYMQVLHGWSRSFPLGKHAHWAPHLLAGGGGGGGTFSRSGGLHAGVGLSLEWEVARNVDLFAVGQWMGTNGPLHYSGVTLGVRKSTALATAASSRIPAASGLPRSQPVVLGVGAKAYAKGSTWSICPGGEVQLGRWRRLSWYGSTWWAALGGDFGAYAEGLLDTKWQVAPWMRLGVSGGVGAGGGVNAAGSAVMGGAGVELGRRGVLRVYRFVQAPTPWSVSWVVPLSIPLLRA